MDKKSQEKTTTSSHKDDSDGTIIKVEGEISDTWITTKVKTSLVYAKHVPGFSVKVSTRDGVVTLSGCVESRSARLSAIKRAKEVNGVKRVDSKDLVFDKEKEKENI